MITIADLFPVPVDLQLKHPRTGEDLGVSLKLVGQDSSEFRNARDAYILASADKDTKPTPADSQKALDELMGSLIIGWSSDEFFQGAFSKEAAVKLISNPGYAWLRDQVSAFTDKRANFFRADV